MKMTIAYAMHEIMINQNRKSIWYGDLDLIEKCAKACHLSKKHPQKTIQSILNGLDYSDLFRKTYIYADFNGCKRRYRCFQLK